LNLDRFRAFLLALPRGHDYVFEFRNETWITDEVLDLMERRGVGFCIFQLAGHLTPLHVTGKLAYVRLHGPGRAYQGSYSDGDLRLWAARVKGWIDSGKDAYVYFDNDQGGYAAADAARLARLLGEGEAIPGRRGRSAATSKRTSPVRSPRRRTAREAGRTIFS
jgi:uncharacterized protein YecE (DUF72 family)